MELTSSKPQPERDMLTKTAVVATSRQPPPRRAKSEAVERMCQRLSHLQYPLPSLYSPKRDTESRPKPKLPPEEIAALRAKANLNRIQYHVTQECGTEPAGTGQYLKLNDTGMYLCVICGAELFSSDTKFDSGCGWPAFYDIVNHKNVNIFQDKSHGMVRTEVSCSQCGAHLGHLFDEKFLTPTGQRYCINSASLKFERMNTQAPNSDTQP